MEKMEIQYKNNTLTFEKDLKLDVGQIDEQHHTLFRLTHAVNQLLDRSPSREEIALYTLELEAYVQEHLDFEETLMSKNGFGDFPAHKRAHDDFAKTARALIARISDPGISDFQQAARELFGILSDWLVDHIMTEDRAAKDFMVPGEHGVRPRPPRIAAEDDVVVAFSGTEKVSGRLVNVSPKSLLVHLSAPRPGWLVQGAQAKLHLLPLGAAGDVDCRILRTVPEPSVVAALDEELDIRQIAKLIKG